MARRQQPQRRSLAANPAVWVTVVVAVLAAVLYSPARNMPFFFDDTVTVVHNKWLHSPSISEALSENPFRGATNFTYFAQIRFSAPGEGVYGLLDASPHISKGYTFDEKRLQAYFRDPKSGDSYPVTIDTRAGLVYPLPPTRPFRTFNLVLHLINALLLYAILGKLKIPRAPALMAWALFALHPMATETVIYISARFDLMALLFSLAAVRAHLEADENPNFDFLALAFFGLALISKESAAALPAAVVILDAARGRFSRRVLIGFVVSIVYFIARLNWIIILDSGKVDTLTWPQYLLVQQSVLWLYLAKILVPIHQNYDYNYHPALVRDLVFAAINAAVVAAAAIALAPRLKRKPSADQGPWPAGPGRLVWPLLVGFALISPTSSVIPLGESVREMRAYPLLAVICAWVPAALWSILNPNRPIVKRAMVGLAAAILVLFCLLTFARSQKWSNDLTMARDAMRKSPAKSRVMFNYASSLLWWQRYEESLYWTKRVLEVRPNHAEARYNVIILEDELKKRTGRKTSADRGEMP